VGELAELGKLEQLGELEPMEQLGELDQILNEMTDPTMKVAKIHISPVELLSLSEVYNCLV
jgi:hypothetical protein